MTVRSRTGRWFVLACAGCLLGSVPAYASGVVTSGLLAWYQAEGNYADAVGGHDGTAVGTVGFAPGVRGQAFDLTGPGLDHVRVVDAAGVFSPAQITVEAWAQLPAGTSDPRSLVSKFNHSNGTSTDDSFYLAVVGDQLRWQVDVVPPGGGIVDANFYVPLAASITGDGRYHQIVGTFDGATQSVYLDGVLLASRAQAGTVQVTATDLLLGASYRISEVAVPLDGLLDEVRIYDRALSAAEIAQNFAATPAVVPEGNALLLALGGLGVAALRARLSG